MSPWSKRISAARSWPRPGIADRSSGRRQACHRRPARPWIGFALDGGAGEAREGLIAVRRAGGERGERGLRVSPFVVMVQRQRLLESGAGRLLGGDPAVLEEAIAGGAKDDQHHDANDEVLMLLPELERLVAADFLVYFLKDVAHRLVRRFPSPPRSGRLSRSEAVSTSAAGKRAQPLDPRAALSQRPAENCVPRPDKADPFRNALAPPWAASFASTALPRLEQATPACAQGADG